MSEQRQTRESTDRLTTALNLLLDEQSPDYTNSIIESISAVEATCRSLTGNPKVTLRESLEELGARGKMNLHPDLTGTLSRLNTFARRTQKKDKSLPQEFSPGIEEARLVWLACAAFINYLTARATRAGIILQFLLMMTIV